LTFEIERKFLVKGDFKSSVRESSHVVQGYLASVPERTVRVRIRDDQGYLTVKGMGSGSGLSRFEWEIKIPVKDAEDLLRICEPGVIDKTRHLVKSGDHLFEVDEFHGENEGLVLAEVELSAEDEQIIKPEWLGKEVTGQKKYYNAMLKKHPYKYWREK
jgi:adenylate cyclase